jgi:hypothetical protein
MHEEEGEFDYDIRDTLRKQVKLDHFSSKCSEVIDVRNHGVLPW